MRKFLAALTAAALACVLGACSGAPDPASDITGTSAKLNAHGTCGTGERCSWQWRWRPQGSASWTTSPLAGPVNGPSSTDVHLEQAVKALKPGGVYEWQIGGRGHDGDALAWQDGQSFDTSRFFAPTSFWNTPATRATHPNSQAMMAWLTGKMTSAIVAWSSWGVPLNLATNSDPRRDVPVPCFGANETVHNVSIPAGVANSGDGGDNHAAILNTDTGELWDFWKFDPATVTAQCGSLDNEPGDGNHTDVPRQSARGSSFDLVAGLMQPLDFQKGVIPHALFVSLPGPRSGGPVAPSLLSDGTDSSPDAIPEGAQLRLPASFDCSTYAGWQGVLCAALKRYGMFVGDNSGSNSGQVELEALDVDASSTVYGHGQSYPWGAEAYPAVSMSLIRNMEVVQW